MNTVLDDAVDRFVADLTPVLAQVTKASATGRADKAPGDVTLEAFNLAAAVIDSDNRHTDDELWALVTAFAPRFDTMLQYAGPDDVRKARLVEGKRRWLESPSVLFEILLATDQRQGTGHARLYYEDALGLTHAVCALDAHAARSELEAVDRFRTVLLAAMDQHSVPRPGTPGALAGAGTGTGPGGADAEGAAALEPPLEPARPIEELLAELDGLIGLEPVKAEVRLVTNLIRVQNLRKERGLAVADSSRHLIFTGNPGTGKTTVARLVAQIYRSLGVVAKGHLVETDRSQLVAGYIGQTAIQVRKVVESALGGLLLVDEAYALARGGSRDFGQEAIDTLVKLMEDHRDDFVVIAAGYTEEMAEFIDSNPGLRSRFPKTIHFPDYTDDELIAIFESMGKKSSYHCPPEVAERLRLWFASQVRDKGFGNARLARNLFEAAVARHATRVVAIAEPTDEHLTTLSPEDVPAP